METELAILKRMIDEEELRPNGGDPVVLLGYYRRLVQDRQTRIRELERELYRETEYNGKLQEWNGRLRGMVGRYDPVLRAFRDMLKNLPEEEG